MKACPRCGSIAFDDMPRCYGCLYEYEPECFQDVVFEYDVPGLEGPAPIPLSGKVDETLLVKTPMKPLVTLKLHVSKVDGSADELVIPCFENTRVRIGRAADNDVVLDDATVSRYHACIQCVDGALMLEDTGSKNHTILDGEVLTGEGRLRTGSRMRIGMTGLQVAL